MAPFAPLIARLPCDRVPESAELNALLDERLCNSAGVPIRFVCAGDAAQRGGEGHEARIYRSGEIAMRPANWHDLFNALAWITYPQTKRELNRLHGEHIRAEAERGQRGQRGTARDLLTLFDEDGMLVACADPGLAGLLVNFRWKELFWARRAEVVRAMRFQVFGHALADKLRAPFRGLTAKALLLAVDPELFTRTPEEQLTELDARAASCIRDASMLASTRVLAPLPVLGIPDWHADNARAEYYDDTEYFRPGRSLRGVHSRP